MAFPPYSAWPQAPPVHPWSAYGGTPTPASLPSSLPHRLLPGLEQRSLAHSSYMGAAPVPAAKASQPNVLDAASLGLVGWSSQVHPHHGSLPPQMVPPAVAAQPPPWPAMASGYYPRAPQAPPPLATASLGGGSDASSRVVEAASSTTMPAVLSGESEKENLPIGMNWGARMVDSLLATTETSESSKERLVTGDPGKERCVDLVEKDSDDEASDSNFTEVRFRMLLIRQLLEEELSKPSVLKLRTVSASDARLPPEHDENTTPAHRRVPKAETNKDASSPSRAHVAPLAPEDPVEAGAFLLQLVKERENEGDGTQLLRQLQGGGATAVEHPALQSAQQPSETKRTAESTSKGSSWTPTLRPATSPGNPPPIASSRSDGIAEGAALLGLLQGGTKAEQDGAAMGSALLRQLQGGKTEAPSASSKSPAWQGGQTWEDTQWENSTSRRQRGGKSRAKKGDEWW